MFCRKFFKILLHEARRFRTHDKHVFKKRGKSLVPDWILKLPWQHIHAASKQYGIDARLIGAIVEVESAGNQSAIRFEPHWRYFYEVDLMAVKCNVTAATEKVLQQCSFGLMQVMGSVARELGFKYNLIRLCEARVGLEYGCKKLRQLLKKYEMMDAISSYNQGAPYKVNGRFKHEQYVDKVAECLRDLNMC